MVNFGLLTAEICWRVGHPANFNGLRVLASLLQRRRSPEANQTLDDLWPSPGLVHCIYIFGILGALAPRTEFCHVQNSLCVQVLRSRILAVLLHGTPQPASAKLRHGTRNRIMELLQRAPPIFGLAAITLGIGPHSSLLFFPCLISAVKLVKQQYLRPHIPTIW